MKHNGIEYDVIWFDDNEYNSIDNKPDFYEKETLLVNKTNLNYYHRGEIKNKPNPKTIDIDLKNCLNNI